MNNNETKQRQTKFEREEEETNERKMKRQTQIVTKSCAPSLLLVALFIFCVCRSVVDTQRAFRFSAPVNSCFFYSPSNWFDSTRIRWVFFFSSCFVCHSTRLSEFHSKQLRDLLIFFFLFLCRFRLIEFHRPIVIYWKWKFLFCFWIWK